MRHSRSTNNKQSAASVGALTRAFAPLALAVLVPFALADAPLNEWESLQPTGMDNGVGGLAVSGYSNAAGRGVMRSAFGNLYTRASNDSAWMPLDLVIDGQPVRGLSSITAHPAFPDTVTAYASYGSPNGGIVRSTDAAQTWTTIYSFNFLDSAISGLAVAPGDPDVIYLRDQDAGIIKTTNGGDTWNVIADTAPDGFAEIFIDPLDSEILYTSDDGTLVKSVDGGVSFAPANAGMNPNFDYIENLAIDLNNGNNLYAASSNFGIVFKSVDAGASWSEVRLSSVSPNPPVSAVAIDPTDSTHLFAASGFSGSGRIFESVDAGETWTPLADPERMVGATQSIRFTADGEAMVLGGTGVILIGNGELMDSNLGFNDFSFRGVQAFGQSADQWYGWSQLSGVVSTNPTAPQWTNRRATMGPGTNDLHVDAADPLQLYAASTDGLYASQNGGATWNLLPTPGFPFFSSVTASPFDINRVYATQSGNLIVSGDGGLNWNLWQIDGSDPTPQARHPVVSSAADPLIAYVATNENGLYATDDGGIRWAQSDAPFQNERVNDIELDPLDANGVYIATQSDVWYSPDDGKNWTSLGADEAFGEAWAIVVDPVVRGRVFARGSQGVWARDPSTQQWRFVAPRQLGQGGALIYGEIITGDGVTSGRVVDALVDLFVIQLDSDLDEVGDDVDNCILTVNPNQIDSDGDGLGNACDADIAPGVNDCVVNAQDLGALRAAFLSVPGDANWNPAADFDTSNSINVVDLAIMRSAFFGRPGYSSGNTVCR
ncbi:MAG: YCF48-related protein [Gammaproteobacteria bacterium]